MLYLRLPNLAEIGRLFLHPTRVDHVVAGVAAQAAGLRQVADGQVRRAKRHSTTAAVHRAAANRYDRDSVAASAEADRAARVAKRLQELVS